MTMSNQPKRSNSFLWMLLLLALVIIVASARNMGTKVDFFLPNFHLRIMWPWLITCLAFSGFLLGWLSRLGGLRKKSQIIKDKNKEIDGLNKKMEGVMASMAAIGAQARSGYNAETVSDTETRLIEDTSADTEDTELDPRREN